MTGFRSGQSGSLSEGAGEENLFRGRLTYPNINWRDGLSL